MKKKLELYSVSERITAPTMLNKHLQGNVYTYTQHQLNMIIFPVNIQNLFATEKTVSGMQKTVNSP